MMANGDKFMWQSMFDFLKYLNENIQKPSAGVYVCVYNGFWYDVQERRDRCMEYAGACDKCIADCLNECPFERSGN